MRKLFRMKYESCTGMCYAPSDVMKIHTLGLDVKGAAAFLKRLLAMHAPSCGNDSLSFALDADEEYGMFLATFVRYGAIDHFIGKTPLEAMDKMIDGALAYYQTQEFADFNKNEFGDVVFNRGDVCHHGTDEKLVKFALTFSGLDEADQELVRAELL
jgi:hypothetical protein